MCRVFEGPVNIKDNTDMDLTEADWGVCRLKTFWRLSTWCVQVLRSPKEASAAAMHSWRERCEKCVCLQGDYVEKLLHFQLPVVSSFFLIN